MKMKTKCTAIILLLFVWLGSASAGTVEVSASPVTKLAEKNTNFSVNITLDPNGTKIAGAQFNLVFNKSKLNMVNTAAGNSTEGDLFNRNSTSFYNQGVINNSAGMLLNVFSVIIGPYNTTAKGNMSTITMVALRNDTDWLNLSTVKVATPEAEPAAYNLTVGYVCVSPNYDINCIDHKVNIIDSTILNQNWNKSGTVACPQYEGRCKDIVKDACDCVNILDKTVLQANYGKSIVIG